MMGPLPLSAGDVKEAFPWLGSARDAPPPCVLRSSNHPFVHGHGTPPASPLSGRTSVPQEYMSPMTSPAHTRRLSSSGPGMRSPPFPSAQDPVQPRSPKSMHGQTDNMRPPLDECLLPRSP